MNTSDLALARQALLDHLGIHASEYEYHLELMALADAYADMAFEVGLSSPSTRDRK